MKFATRGQLLADYRDDVRWSAELERRLFFTRAANVRRCAVQDVFNRLYSKHPRASVTRHAKRIHVVLERVKQQELNGR